MNKLAENLATAESMVQEAQSVKPMQEEIDAIKNFCAEEIKRRSIIDEASQSIKAARMQQKNLKAQLQKIMESSKCKCMGLSKDLFKKYNDMCAVEKLPDMPPYLRIIQTNKDSSITPEIIEEAIESISTEDLKDAEQGDISKIAALRSTVLNSVKRLIRSYADSLKVTSSIPRGNDSYDIPEASAETSELMYKYWSLENEIKRTLLNKKHDASDKKELSDLKEKIETYFVRTGLTAQRVVVHKKSYRLVRRISIRKQKIGVGKFEKILDDVLGSIKDSIKKEDLSRNLQIQLSSIPPDTKSQVVLCKMPED